MEQSAEESNDLELILARPEDLDAVVTLLAEAARWLKTKGIKQWDEWRAPIIRQWMEEPVAQGQVYLVRLSKEIIGTFQLIWSDERTWGKISDDGGYIHKLTISRKQSGKGLGLCILRRAEELAKIKGKAYLRLDCVSENKALCQYYERAGYTFKRKIELGPWKINLYEKHL